MCDKYVLSGVKLAMMELGALYGMVEVGVVVIDGVVIVWCGFEDFFLVEYKNWLYEDLGGRLMMLGLIDCYMYIVFGGDCVGEFEMCFNGVSYEEVVKVGGGIVSMVMVGSLVMLVNGEIIILNVDGIFEIIG